MSDRNLSSKKVTDESLPAVLRRRHKSLREDGYNAQFLGALERAAKTIESQQSDLQELTCGDVRYTRLAVALRKLANEVDGMLSIARHAMRETASNTNVECLELRLREAREALSGDGPVHETSERRETAWLVESGAGAPNTEYRTMDQMGSHWTKDINKAIRFARRADAEMFGAGDEDAWCVAEHEWVTPSVVETSAKCPHNHPERNMTCGAECAPQKASEHPLVGKTLKSVDYDPGDNM